MDENLDGIIIINKEKGMTSYDIIRNLKKILKTSKIGHTGTLDPIAEGVIIVCVGKSTKLASKIESQFKTYIAEMELGYTTITYDSEGEIIFKSNLEKLKIETIYDVINHYVGWIYQIPPMYSAIKVNGNKLYELARKGIEIEREKRKVYVEYIKINLIENNKVVFETKVSKGTYIRSLIYDIGMELKTYACMTKLKRIQVGDYTIKDAFKLSEIENMIKNEDFSFLIGAEEFFKKIPNYNILEYKDFNLFKNGNTVVIREDYNYNGNVKVYFNNKFIGIGIVNNKKLKGDRYF